MNPVDSCERAKDDGLLTMGGPLNEQPDAFKACRSQSKVLNGNFQGETLPMILGHADVRQAARDWQRFSSDAPFRVPIPSEEEVRSIRQLPVETDPPEHGVYRKIMDPFFQRPKSPQMMCQVGQLVGEMVEWALAQESVEVVRAFALPIQSRAMTYLLAMPEEEAQVWIQWGTHVFKDGEDGAQRGAGLEAYLNRKLDEAMTDPLDESFFGALVRAKIDGRTLTREEQLGFANLTFAGGRDTVIHSISSTLHYLASQPESLAFLKEDVSRITHATEELFRAITPLTHIGRVCPVETEVHGQRVPAGGRVSICWAAANYDPEVFHDPEEVQLDRKPNPHVAFGFGHHLCIGAAHARLVIRSLLEACVERITSLDILEAVPALEEEEPYRRAVGFHTLHMRWHP